MNRKIFALPLSLVLAGTLFGCTPAAEPAPEESTSQASVTTSPSSTVAATAEAEKVNDTEKNVSILAKNATEALKDSDFRTAMAEFLASGKLPSGFDQQFEDMSALVSKDEAWDSEKKAYLETAKKNPDIVTGGDNVDLYLSSMVVSTVLSPELLDSVENPRYEMDSELLGKKDGLLTWTGTAGLRSIDSEGVIHAVAVPMNEHFFADNGAKVSAKGILTSNITQNATIDTSSLMTTLLVGVQGWIDSNAERLEVETDLAPFTQEIFDSIELPNDIAAGGDITTSISGTVADYVVEVDTAKGKYTISSDGQSSFGAGKQEEAYEITMSAVGEAWDTYQTIYLMALSESGKEPTLDAVVKSMKESGAPKGGSWSVGSSKDSQYAELKHDGKTYKFYDLTAVAG